MQSSDSKRTDYRNHHDGYIIELLLTGLEKEIEKALYSIYCRRRADGYRELGWFRTSRNTYLFRPSQVEIFLQELIRLSNITVTPTQSVQLPLF